MLKSDWKEYNRSELAFTGGGRMDEFGVDGGKTGFCGICLREIGRSPVGQLNGVLTHTSCYGKAMEMLRALTILRLSE